MIKLIDAEEKYLDEYRKAYILTLKKVKEGLVKKHNLMFVNLNEVDIVQENMNQRDISKLKPGYVIAYNYFVVDKEKFIGVINIRTELTPRLLNYGGHIGYAVNPRYWKQGYGTKILELGLLRAKELGIKDKVLITCDDDNIGSYKIIEKNGGILENKIENEDMGEKFLTRRYWIKLK